MSDDDRTNVTHFSFIRFSQIIRNSWSEKWGDNGYVLVKRGVDLCQIESDAMYTTVN